MDPLIVGVIGLIILFALLAIGLPVGFGMALVGFAGLWYLVGDAAAMLKMAITAFGYVSWYDLTVLPLFLLMAQVCSTSGLTGDLYNLAAKWLGRLPGGLAIGTVAGCAGFSAVSASSIACAATMGSVAIPEMKRHNYDPALATGCVAAGGTMGILIPPSGMLILYGIITGTSIGKLFIAGIVPGVLQGIFYIAVILILCTWKPSLGPKGPSYSLKEKMLAFRNCGEIVALILLILGGMMIGWFTPTEAGAVGAFGAILFTLFRRRLNWKGFVEAGILTMKTTGMIFIILIGAMTFMYFITLTGLPAWLSDFVTTLPLPPLGIMVCILVIYLILGALMDVSAMIFLTIPIFFPVAMSLGFNAIWFGIIVTRMMEMGMITPPIGMNVFVISGMSKVPMKTVFKGIIPFAIADVFHVALLLLVPAVVLFLPGLMR